MKSPRFPMTYCSQCGSEQGPGDAGVSHCSDHRATERPFLQQKKGKYESQKQYADRLKRSKEFAQMLRGLTQ